MRMLVGVLALALGSASPRTAAQSPSSPALDFPYMAALLNDYVFQDTWKNRSIGELFERIRMTMPQNEPGTLSPERTAQIVAHILSANELPPGDRALGEDVEALRQIRMDPVQP